MPAKKASHKKSSAHKKAPARKTTVPRKKTTGAKKKSSRKYGVASQKKVQAAMEEMKEGKLRSGRSGKKVTNPKQAIAIGLSEARSEGAKVPEKKS